MTTIPGHASIDEKHCTFPLSSDSETINGNDVLLGLPTCPLRIAEMAIEIQLEKLRVTEALNARDVLVQKLSDAYTSVREKTELIDRLQQALNSAMSVSNNASLNHTIIPSPPVQQNWEHPDEIAGLRTQVTDIESLIQNFRIGSRSSIGPPPQYEEEERKNFPPNIMTISDNAQTISASTSPLAISTPTLPGLSREDRSVQTLIAEEPEDMVNARFAILASIPLPANPPDDTLKPIVLPSSCTLHEFLSSTSGTLRNSLGNYRVLQSLTTKWCPNREEHGYFYSPVFKCSTNPRVTTAHRWQQVDVTARMKHPTECFYNREGLWYYAGSYQAFRLEDLTLKEWTELSTETSTYLVKETISGRKNVSPQNIYEVTQLYNAGALKIACVGLQCVGFNQEVYKSVLDHAAKFTQAKWKAMNTAATTPILNNSSSPPAIAANLGSVVSNAQSAKPAIPPVKPTAAGISRPVSPTLLGSTNTGFGAVAAGLGLGNGSIWNTTAALLAQGSGNQPMLSPPAGSDGLQVNETGIIGYRPGAKK